jgi:hypothetical protein
VKGFEAKVQVYGVELAKYVLITSWCYVLYLLCEVRIESNPASQVYARSFFKNNIFIRTFVSSRHFLLRDAAKYLYLWNITENICLSPLSGIRTVLQRTEIDVVATHAFISRTPGSVYWF